MCDCHCPFNLQSSVQPSVQPSSHRDICVPACSPALLNAPTPSSWCSFVFEGKPPELKRAELAKRSTKREDATRELEAAKEVGGGGSRRCCCS